MSPKVKSFEVKHCSIDELMLNKQLDLVDVESSFGFGYNITFKKRIKLYCEVYFCFIVEAIPDPWKSTHDLKNHKNQNTHEGSHCKHQTHNICYYMSNP